MNHYYIIRKGSIAYYITRYAAYFVFCMCMIALSIRF